MTVATKKIALTAAFCALSAVLTLISVPLPGGGYYNFGDVPVFVATATLGPVLGALVGAVGGLLGDLCLGYAAYAPFSLIIKAVEAFVAGTIFAALKKTLVKNGGTVRKTAVCFSSCFAGGLIMAAGYFLAEGLLLAEGKWQGGIVNLPWNILQGTASAFLASVVLFPFRIGAATEKMLYGTVKKDKDESKDADAPKSERNAGGQRSDDGNEEKKSDGNG